MVKIPSLGDIIYINFNPSTGFEIKKRRPAVVVSNNILMQTSPFMWVVPISHGNFNGENYPLHVNLNQRCEVDGTVYIEQIKSFDYKNRNWQFVEKIPEDLLKEIQYKLNLVTKI